jgi:hypothetical protein
MTCKKQQTRNDLVDTLFDTRDEVNPSTDRLSSGQFKHRPHETTTISHKPSRSTQTFDSRVSEKSQASYGGQASGSRNTSIKVSL